MLFIVGKGRSGTTLLSTIIDSHSEVASSTESRFIFILWKRYGKMKRWNKAMADEFYQNLMLDLHVKRFWTFHDDFIETLRALPEETTFPDLIKLIHLNRKSSFPKKKIKYIIDKNPFYTPHLDFLKHIFPEAIFYRLIRDPRDNVNSHFKKFSESIGFFANRWVHFNQLVDQFTHTYPNQVYTQRFEDLITDKKNFFDEFERITGIDSLMKLEEKRINFKTKIEAKFDQRQKDLHKESVKPLNSGKIGEFKAFFSQDQIDTIDAICFPYANQYQYDNVGQSIQLSPFKKWIWQVKLNKEKLVRKTLYRTFPFSFMKLFSVLIELKQKMNSASTESKKT